MTLNERKELVFVSETTLQEYSKRKYIIISTFVSTEELHFSRFYISKLKKGMLFILHFDN